MNYSFLRHLTLAALAAGVFSGNAFAGDAAKGKVAYVKNGCYQCHGTVGQGGAGAKLAPKPAAGRNFHELCADDQPPDATLFGADPVQRRPRRHLRLSRDDPGRSRSEEHPTAQPVAVDCRKLSSSCPALCRASRLGERCLSNRDGRDKPGHDNVVYAAHSASAGGPVPAQEGHATIPPWDVTSLPTSAISLKCRPSYVPPLRPILKGHARFSPNRPIFRVAAGGLRIDSRDWRHRSGFRGGNDRRPDQIS